MSFTLGTIFSNNEALSYCIKECLVTDKISRLNNIRMRFDVNKSQIRNIRAILAMYEKLFNTDYLDERLGWAKNNTNMSAPDKKLVLVYKTAVDILRTLQPEEIKFELPFRLNNQDNSLKPPSNHSDQVPLIETPPTKKRKNVNIIEPIAEPNSTASPIIKSYLPVYLNIDNLVDLVISNSRFKKFLNLNQMNENHMNENHMNENQMNESQSELNENHMYSTLTDDVRMNMPIDDLTDDEDGQVYPTQVPCTPFPYKNLMSPS
jgi:hypothetical protein